VDPGRLGIIGGGQFRPAADNSSEEGRNRNRRVLVVVLSDGNAPSRFYSDAEHPIADAPAPPQPAGVPAAAPATLPALPGLITVNPEKNAAPAPAAATISALQTPEPENKG
jgi:chemotaxis protein MotB